MNGLIARRSTRGVAETVAAIRDQAQQHGANVVAVVDHAAAAQSAGLSMPATQVIIFGNPKAGTPVMLAAPSVAIDLPLKILVWEDGQGRVWLSYNSPAYLMDRHGVPQALLPNIAVAETLARGAGE